MKSFQAVIIAAILAAATAANEPVASPTFFKQELAEYEHRLRELQSMSLDRGTPATSPPTPSRPDDRGSMSYSSVSMSYYGGKGGKSGFGGSGKGGKSGSKVGKSDGGYSYSTSMSYSSGKSGKSGVQVVKAKAAKRE